MSMRFHSPLTASEQLDVLNHVNNKAYMSWFETVRVSYFDLFCADQYAGGQRPRIVLRNANIHYMEEMRIGEIYIATARVTSFRTTSYTMEQQIWSGGRLRCVMKGVLVMRTPDGATGFALPDALRRDFMARDGAQPES